ncbi:PMP-22/EMP/MP20/Claudin superfamily [Cinara cedri]|uniref:PMP-22/EMP/MP20/Claudin superfamily n=1 Tax=Cinara cedri TaxID=506608 RepID=A0A5E4NNC1_9HEMI|nr:PMP-22/EMP/MP20/Claudin superfamily [Cinara cedri]
MAVSKNGLIASYLSVLGTLLALVAFATENWLVTDKSGRKFDRIGLWVVCFKNLEDSHRWYDVKLINSCRSVFGKQYYIIHDILFGNNRFYHYTQFWFTVCVLSALVGLYHTKCYVKLSSPAWVDGHRVKTAFRTGVVYIISAVFGTVALVIFGIHGVDRTWMPDWRHNHIGWSYGVGVAGTIALWVGGILYAIEGRALKIKLRKRTTTRKPNTDDKLQGQCSEV